MSEQPEQRSMNLVPKQKEESVLPVATRNEIKKQDIDFSGEIGEITKHTMELVLTYIFTVIMKPINNMMSGIKSNLEELEPSSIQDEYTRNQLILKAINVVLSKPETMEDWEKASENIALYIKTVINKIEDETLEDLKRVLQKVIEQLEKSSQTAILNIANGVITALCAIPIVSPFCEVYDLANIAVSAVASGATAAIAVINTTNQLVTLLLGVLGDEITGLKDVADMLSSLNKKIQGAMDVIENGKQGLSDIDNKIQSTTQELRDGKSSIKETSEPIS